VITSLFLHKTNIQYWHTSPRYLKNNKNTFHVTLSILKKWTKYNTSTCRAILVFFKLLLKSAMSEKLHNRLLRFERKKKVGQVHESFSMHLMVTVLSLNIM
jgi:hypothetical protein